MKIPKRLAPLVEDGLVDEVIRQLMSGKEAVVFVVRCGDNVRCAKVYKEAEQRSFQNNALYQEGRRTKNSRQARAMAKGSKYGPSSRNRPGRVMRWIPCTSWPPLACAYRSLTISTKAYC